MSWNCLIVDDEPIARRVIRTHLEKLDRYEVAAEFGDGLKAFDYLQKEPVDLLFLDIEMPGLTGISLADALDGETRIIFTTAYRNYAVDAFEVDALDYLVKPISLERLLKALKKFEATVYAAGHDKKRIETTKAAHRAPAEEPFIYVTADRKTRKIYLKGIRYIESLKDYVTIHTEDERIITREPIKQMEAQLPEAHFLRIHRSFIINTRKLRSLTADEVEMENKTLPIGRTYKDLVRAALGLE